MNNCQRCKKVLPDRQLIKQDKYLKKDGILRIYYRCSNCCKTYNHKWGKTHLKEKIQAVYKSIKKYPWKNLSRQKTRYAIRIGKLVRKPCENCGEQKAQAHHDDYSKPLKIKWLCSTCHAILHKKLSINNKELVYVSCN